MKPSLSFLLLLLTFVSNSGVASKSSEETIDFIIENVNVITMTEEAVLRGKAIAVREGKIVAVVNQTEASRYKATKRVNGNNQYVIPGLADMHVHMRMHPKAMFNLLLANGVTTAANMRLADGEVDHIALRDAVVNGKMRGPRYLVGGPMLKHEVLPNVDSVAAVLESHIKEQYDFIKIHDDLKLDVFNALLDGAKQLSLPVTGHTQRLLPLRYSLRMSSIEHVEEFLYVTEMGLDAEPGNFLAALDKFINAYQANIQLLQNPDYRKELAKKIADSGIYLDPTLTIYKYIALYLNDTKLKALESDPRLSFIPKSTVEENLNPEKNGYRRNMFGRFGPAIGLKTQAEIADHFARNVKLLMSLTKDLHEAGVPLLLGTDAFGAVVPGFATHQELELLVESGLSPYEALKTGTVNVAAYLGESNKSGTIEKGKIADFVLIANNPLINIRHAEQVQGVFTQTNWYADQDLNDFINEAASLANY
ncbi:amidohydrolase family protein [Arenicella sp. 4NH20-0111]|uniref:amidohydrolase family protein n=1 Tax=Arenicella sp. 4NH20-0111 TaxID=3127648 RepID=UPI0033425EBC